MENLACTPIMFFFLELDLRNFVIVTPNRRDDARDRGWQEFPKREEEEEEEQENKLYDKRRETGRRRARWCLAMPAFAGFSLFMCMCVNLLTFCIFQCYSQDTISSSLYIIFFDKIISLEEFFVKVNLNTPTLALSTTDNDTVKRTKVVLRFRLFRVTEG